MEDFGGVVFFLTSIFGFLPLSSARSTSFFKEGMLADLDLTNNSLVRSRRDRFEKLDSSTITK
jgi:hypothetical protein